MIPAGRPVMSSAASWEKPLSLSGLHLVVIAPACDEAWFFIQGGIDNMGHMVQFCEYAFAGIAVHEVE